MLEQKITLVELPPTLFGKLDGQRCPDVYSQFKLPPRAISLLHANLLAHGSKDVVSIAPQYNNPQKLTAQEWSRIDESDFLLLSTISRTVPQTENLARIYKAKKPEGKVIVGGPHVTFLPDEALEWADFIVRGEGDQTLPELMGALKEGNLPEGVKGVSYKKGTEIVHEEQRPLLTEDAFSKILPPFYPDNIKSGVKIKSLITSRGCPYKCSFCSVSAFYGGRYRRRDNSSVISELQSGHSDIKGDTFFADDNFVGKKTATIELLSEMTNLGFNRRFYSAQVRIEAAEDERLLTSMREGGVNALYVGFESINEGTLKQLNKKSDPGRNMRAARKFKEAGFWVHGMMMVGADEDTPEILDETLEWAKKELDSVQFLALIPLPGTPFAKEMEEQGRVLIKDYSLYDGQHVLIRPIRFTPYELQTRILEMYQDFYSLRHIGHIIRSQEPALDLKIRLFTRFVLGDLSKQPQMAAHLRYLHNRHS